MNWNTQYELMELDSSYMYTHKTQPKVLEVITPGQRLNTKKDCWLMKLPILKSGAVLVFMFLLFVLSSTGKERAERRGSSPIDCIDDPTLDLLLASHYTLMKHSTLRTGLEWMSSNAIDIIAVTIIGGWALSSSNINLCVVLGLFYGIRAVVQGIYRVRFLNATYWASPPLPSLVVPYGDACDFYYSGHCGFMTIMTIMAWRQSKAMGLCVFGLACYVAFIVLLYRIHYTIGKFLSLY